MEKLDKKGKEEWSLAEREKRIELAEIKENLWNKWRVADRKNGEEDKKMTGKEDNMDRKMEKLHETVARMEEDKKVRRRQQIEDSERLFLKREGEKEKKMKRLEKARQLEDNWKMLRWATTYIEDNEEDWMTEIELEEENNLNLN